MNRKVYNVLAAIGLFAMLAAPAIQAQSNAMVADIPFQFTVGKATLPSGEYRIKSVSDSTLMIRSKDGHQGAMAMTVAVTSHESGDTGKLVFNRYGDQYFLSKVLPSGHPTGRALLKSRAELEVAKNTAKPEATNVAIKTP